MGIKERQDRERQAVRQAILDAARDLFVSEGYRNVSIRKIAERIEYSPAAIYSYFPSKDDIFFALAEEGLPPARRQGPRRSSRHDDPLDDVRACWWAYYEFSKEQREFFELMFVDRSVPQITEQWTGLAFVHEMLAFAAGRIQRCIDAGIFAPRTNAEVAMHLIWGALTGPAVIGSGCRLAPGEDPDALARDVLELVIAGLKTGSRHDVRSLYASPCLWMPQPFSVRDVHPMEFVLMTRKLFALASCSFLLAAAVAAACGGDGTTAAAEAPAAPPPAPVVDVAVVRATVGTIESALEISGTLAPRTRVGVKPKLPGRLERVLVDIGDRVTAGQVVATIDRARARRAGRRGDRAVGVAKAAIESAEAALANAMSEHDRAKTLFESGALPRQRLDAAETAHRSAIAQRESGARPTSRRPRRRVRRAREVQRDATLTRAGRRLHRRAQLRRRRDSRRSSDRRRRRHPSAQARSRRVGARSGPAARPGCRRVVSVQAKPGEAVRGPARRDRAGSRRSAIGISRSRFASTTRSARCSPACTRRHASSCKPPTRR